MQDRGEDRGGRGVGAGEVEHLVLAGGGGGRLHRRRRGGGRVRPGRLDAGQRDRLDGRARAATPRERKTVPDTVFVAGGAEGRTGRGLGVGDHGVRGLGGNVVGRVVRLDGRVRSVRGGRGFQRTGFAGDFEGRRCRRAPAAGAWRRRKRKSSTIAHCGAAAIWALSRVGRQNITRCSAASASGGDDALRLDRPGEELVAHAGQLLVDAGDLRVVERVQHRQRQPRPLPVHAGMVGQALKQPVRGDDAVVVAGRQQAPSARPRGAAPLASGVRGLGMTRSQRSMSQFSSSIASVISRML